MKRKIIFPLLKAIYVSFVDNVSNPIWVQLIDDYYDLDGEVALYLRKNGVRSNCVRSDLLDDFLLTRESYQTLENYDNVKKRIEEIGVENLIDCDISEALCLKQIFNYSSIRHVFAVALIKTISLYENSLIRARSALIEMKGA